jgi:Trk K+ transport system NAD-binding subunit
MKTSFLSGIYLSQLSEFGIIILAGAVSAGLVSESMNSIAIISVIASMILSSYLIKYDKSIFKFFEAKIAKFDKRFIVKEVHIQDEHHEANILFFGYYDLNKELFTRFQKKGKSVLVVEKDPENIAIMKKESVPCIYNSINNPEFFEHLNFYKVELAVSNLTDMDENQMLIREIKKYNPKAMVIVSAKHLKESLQLYKLGADYVIYSPSLKEEKVSVILDDYTTDINRVIEKKLADLNKLKAKDAKIDETHAEFSDIDSFVGGLKSKNGRKKEDLNEEAGDREETPEYRTWGDKYI